MARRATVIGTIVDTHGDEWDIRERRPTAHGWDVCIGWPAGQPRGRGGSGGVRVIPTAELVGHLERHRRDPLAAMRLPITDTTIKRLRRELGHHRYLDAAAWWEERIEDLSDLSTEAFAAKHGRSAGAVSMARVALLGRRHREPGWWRRDSALEALLSPWPATMVATFLGGISVGAVRRLRSVLRAEGHAQPDGRDRIAAAKAGIPMHPHTREALSRSARRPWSRLRRAERSRALRQQHAATWTPEQDRKLGTAPDRVIAAALGRTVAAVRRRRENLGIAEPPR